MENVKNKVVRRVILPMILLAGFVFWISGYKQTFAASALENDNILADQILEQDTRDPNEDEENVVWETESNDNITKTNKIDVNSAVKGSLSTSADKDWYSFTLDKPGYVQISFEHEYIQDSHYYWQVYLKSTDNVSFWTDTYGGTKVGEKYGPKIGLDAGTYCIGVMMYGYHSSVTYTVRPYFVESEEWEKEFNETVVTANSIDVNKFVYGSVVDFKTVLGDTDTDWYSFSIPSDGVVWLTFGTEFEENGSTFWKTVLYDDQKESIVYWQWRGNVLGDRDTGKIGLPAGNYYFYVGEAAYRSETAYHFKLNYEVSDDWEKERNDYKAVAETLEFGKSKNGSIMDQTDNDWYKFTVSEDGLIKIVFSHEPNKESSAYWQTYLYSSGSDRSLYNKSYKGSTETAVYSEEIEVSPGDYYILVQDGPVYNWSGTYYISVEFRVPGIKIDKENFPDKIFREYVSSEFDSDKDDELSKEEISLSTSIDLFESDVESLKGIEYFTNLQYLDCSDTLLSALDVSENLELKYLDCSFNQLTEFDVSKNTKLEFLNCGNNQLEGLDVSNEINLKTLKCGSNKLTELDVSKNTNLISLFCDRNQLKELDVSNNTELESLDCGRNQLEELDVSKNIELKWLSCEDNWLADIDLSSNADLKKLYCGENELKVLDVCENTALTYLSCYDNFLSELDVSKNTKLEYLLCSDNLITSLILGENTDLIEIQCKYNKLTSLNVSEITGLQVLSCDDNQLTGIELNPNILSLSCNQNYLEDIDLSQAPKLTELSCYLNEINRLDISKNELLLMAYLNGTMQSVIPQYVTYRYVMDEDDDIFGTCYLVIDREQVVFTGQEPEDQVYLGDINGDNELDAKDVTQLRRYLAGGWNVTIETANADVNGDGAIDAKDVTMLRRYLAGGWGVVLGT